MIDTSANRTRSAARRLLITSGLATLTVVTAIGLSAGAPVSAQATAASTAAPRLLATTAATMMGTAAPTMAGTIASTMAATMAGTALPPLTGSPITIGVATAKTSALAAYGQDQTDGATIAAAYFNAQGGVNGHPIVLKFADSAGNEQGAINAFTSLIADPSVVGILGPTISQQAFAADPLADRAGVPVIAPLNIAAGIPQIGHFVTRVSAPASSYAPSAVVAALKLNPTVKNVVLFFAQDDAFSKSEADTFAAEVQKLGLNLVLKQPFLTTDRDFTTPITNALNTTPGLVIVSGLAVDSATLIKQLRDVGYTGPIVGGDGLNTPNIYPVCQAACDGILIAQAYSYLHDSPVNNDFRHAYTTLKSGKEPGQVVAQAFTGIQVYVEALRRLDEKTPIDSLRIADLHIQLNDAIQSGSYADTPIGPITFTRVQKANGDPAGVDVNQQIFAIAQVKMSADGTSGKFTLLP